MSMATPPNVVLYSLVGEDVEVVEEGKERVPETHLNAFICKKRAPLRLSDVQATFPLGSAFHFAFRNEAGVFIDLANPDVCVPTYRGNVVARATPLVEAPEVHVAAGSAKESSEGAQEYPQDAQFEAEPTSEVGLEMRPKGSEHPARRDYVEFQSFIQEREQGRGRGRGQGDPPLPPPTTPPPRDTQEWGCMDIRDDRRAESSRTDSFERSGGSGNAEWIQKRTEQAYDIAKKMEDAKKGATETAKKARKWGASLLSSVSATISNAANAVKSESIQVGGINVSIVRPLRDGGYAQVFLVRSSGSGEMMALKRIICQSAEVEHDVHTELHVLRSVKHLNVAPLIEFAEARQQNLEFYFLFPYFERGSLWDSIAGARESSSPLWPFDQRVSLHLFRGICAGVLALQHAGFSHRDLKPHNILLTSSSNGNDLLSCAPVITDFGSCAPLRVEIRSHRDVAAIQDEANRKSSAPYRAPELFEPPLDGAIDGQADVWSLGCILYAMAFGGNPFEHPREGFMKLALLNGQVSFPPEQNGIVMNRNARFTQEFCDFIRDMLQTNPEERPSVLDALEFAEELLGDEMKQ